METDILGGVQRGFKTVLVLSGTHREDLARYTYRADQVVESIADLTHANIARAFPLMAGSSRGMSAANPAGQRLTL